ERAPGAFDFAGWHPYGLAVEGYPAEVWGFGKLRESIIAARAIAGKPLWLTEIGANFGYDWVPGVTPQDAVAEYLKRDYTLFRELGADTVAHAFWFTWREPGGEWGMVDNAGSRSSVWHAFQRQAQIPVTPAITQASIAPAALAVGELLDVNITVKNNSSETLTTQGPEPGFVYLEGETFNSRGFPDIPGALRVAIDFDGRVGVDHPYRWGLGAPLAPGETRTITGAIRLRSAQSKNYWAGLVQEQVAWHQDRVGTQLVTTQPGLQITNVTLTPAMLTVGELLTVSATVVNNTTSTLPTQGPEPGFVYDEGDTFVSEGFVDETGNARVGVDFKDRVGIDHPYRWGLGAPLAPGESRVITGAIRMKHPQVQDYWAGIVQEHIAWVQDLQGTQAVMVAALPTGGPPAIVDVKLTPLTLEPGQLLMATITVKNNSTSPLTTQGPDPDFVYEEGESFYTRGFPDVHGAFRVGIDFEGRTGVDHPYRWGLGSPLAPGETRVISGAIRLNTTRTIKYWAGLVQERVAWLQDQQGTQNIHVELASVEPRIVAVTLAPLSLTAGDLLNVSITVKNNSNAPLATQDPQPGFVYDEGESFYTRGFPDVAGAFRVGIDYDARTGVDHPYRWGLGAPLAPGETRTIAGAIRMRRAQSRRYWAGLVQEQVAWLQDNEGAHEVTVASSHAIPRVIQIHNLQATTWNGEPDYWNYVNQDVVNGMVERGMMALTDAATAADAWRALLPRYQPGQGIAIKVNFANGGNGRIDASIQTLNAIVAGLKSIGVVEGDVWVFDASQKIPDRFIEMCQFPGVKFYDNGAHTRAGFESGDPHAYIAWSPPPAGVPPQPPIRITDLIVNATYFINLPIFKGHISGAGVTLGFKNHLGSTNYPSGFHTYIFPASENYRLDYNALVDLYNNPHIRYKTILTIGDGLFTGWDWGAPPMTMARFGNKTPNTLFFATDPVAIDSVMADLLAAEWPIQPEAPNYLRLAEQAGIGVYEHGDPWGTGYQKIDFRRYEEQ
ncbi:MAG: DUF362 domain-containing protein, partial [Chloroflexi bacterium]|nr:DUF362 domain-containing protein [Chloroflexota bacterium]